MAELQRKKISKPKKGAVDGWLALAMGLLLLVGLVILYSASTVESLERFGNTTYFLKNQLLQGTLFGLLALYICSKIDYHWWQKLVPVMVVVSLLLLVMVKIPGVGFSAGGASRWISLGPIFLQPAELAKLAIVIYAAAWIASRKAHLHNFQSGVLPLLVMIALFSLLILWQPDFGTMMALLGTSLVLIIAAGIPWKWIGSLVGTGVLMLLLLIKLEPYRAQRILTFLNPASDPTGAGYQINQSLLAIGSGGLWGLGYGQSRQKHNFLPEVLGDSVFAVMAEELGFIRILLVMGLFVLFLVQGLKVAASAPDMFGRLLATGITAMIVVQVVINLGSMTGILPLTGIPLPFFSYGSSALIVNLAACGVLLNISRQAKA